MNVNNIKADKIIGTWVVITDVARNVEDDLLVIGAKNNSIATLRKLDSKIFMAAEGALIDKFYCKEFGIDSKFQGKRVWVFGIDCIIRFNKKPCYECS
jgi:hypothetical protein